MSQNVPNMLESAIAKIREMVDVNAVVGQPIVAGDTTLIPITKVSIGFGGGGMDKNPSPFSGGLGCGVKVTPMAFLVVHGDTVRMLPVAAAPSTTADRLVEMVPDVLEKVSALLDKKAGKTE